MSYLTESETVVTAPEDAPSKRSFNGVPLDEYSMMHKAADFRIGYGGDMSIREDAILFAYMMTTRTRNAKTWKQEIDGIRGQGMTRFRINAMEWADAAVKTPADIECLIRIAREIREEARKADEVQVEPSKPDGKPEPGNA